ncbi:HU family DNA-binding protein [bacterium]|nr:HU family DNA-binding protein [bacterium]
MAKELFGQYLIRRGLVSQEDIEEALMLQDILKDSLGAVALANDIITYRDVGSILEQVDRTGLTFAECAVELGILTRAQEEHLRAKDEVCRIRIGQLLVATAKLPRQELETELAEFYRQRQLTPSPSLTRADLVERVAERSGLGRDTVKKVLEEVLSVVGDTLAGGGQVRLRGFGAFITREQPAHAVRDPRSGSSLKVPSRRVARLEFARALRRMVEQGKGC